MPRGDVSLSMQGVDPVVYREAMSRYAGHVQIVTTEFEGVRRGVTITAACSVSDSPPMVLACLNNSNPNNAVLFESPHFVLNTLAAHHQDLANAFAGFGKLSSEDRFALAEWQVMETGSPFLADAIAAFDCVVTDRKVTNTHTVLFGEVRAVHIGQREPSLIYLDRGYRTL